MDLDIWTIHIKIPWTKRKRLMGGGSSGKERKGEEKLESVSGRNKNMVPGLTKLSEKNFWNQEWKKVALPIRVNKLHYTEYRIAKLLKKICMDDKNIKVLEVGCGCSKWMHYFYSDLGMKNIFGFDYSEIGCKLTRENLKLFSDTKAIQNVICGDIFYSPFKERSFDIIYSFGVIEHFENPGEILKLISKLLKPGGIIITTVPNYEGLCGLLQYTVSADIYYMHKKIGLKDLKNWYKTLRLKLIKIGYFGSFSLTASVTWESFSCCSPLHYFFSKFFIRALNAIITLPLRIISCEIETSIFSPFLLAIGQNLIDKEDWEITSGRV